MFEDYDDEIVVLFESEEDAYNFGFALRKLLIFMTTMPLSSDSSTMKIFIKADTNKNFTLSSNELSNMFYQLKLADQTEIDNIVSTFKN
jgi:hypothetical protein